MIEYVHEEGGKNTAVHHVSMKKDAPKRSTGRLQEQHSSSKWKIPHFTLNSAFKLLRHPIPLITPMVGMR